MPKVKPGWYVLAAVTLYAVIATVLLGTRDPVSGTPAEGRPEDLTSTSDLATSERADQTAPALQAAPDERPDSASERSASDVVSGPGSADSGAAGLWYPIPGARLPNSDNNLPGAPRAYRAGVSQGLDFHDGDVDVPVPYGAAVIASAAAQVIRADSSYVEMESGVWELLLDDVADGATEEELDKLRGRQVWLQTPAGVVLRYGHLESLANGVAVGRNVYRGQVIGYVGNSGTDDGVAGNRDGARLRFEIWEEDGDFFGEGADAAEVRLAAASLFVGP